MGLGGAEFRLPLLIGTFGFPVLEAVILNKAMSLVVVATALPFRAGTVPFGAIADHWDVIANLLAGSLVGAWFGASWATRLKSEMLHKIIAALLVLIAVVLLVGHGVAGAGRPVSPRPRSDWWGRGGRLRHRYRCCAARRSWRRVAYSHADFAVWRRYQARREPITCCEPSNHDDELCSLQPRSKLRGAWQKSSLRPDHGGRLSRRQLPRRSASRVVPALRPHAPSGSSLAFLCCEGLASPVM